MPGHKMKTQRGLRIEITEVHGVENRVTCLIIFVVVVDHAFLRGLFLGLSG